MKNLRPAIVAVLLATSSLAAPLNSAFAQTCACGGGGGGYAIQAEEPPPPMPVYDQPPIPEPGYLWTPGYWSYNGVDYYWVPGTWIEPPHPGLLWTQGYWAFVGGAYVFNRGYWGPHVGFYGGISYGFGYTGSGYQGGRWDNGVFFYNRSVDNITNVHITNVYNEPVVENVTNRRVSFNGGEGGTVAKPTAEEELAAKEPHVKRTAQQIENTRAASMNAGSFVTTNHGRPTVAATPRPGVLKGPGVVKAKIAGTSETTAPATELKPKEETAPTKEPPTKLEKPAGETKPEREKLEKPAAVETKPEREKLEKPAVESQPKLEKPVAAKPEPKAKKPECGHPGEPACK
jgi:hypothetical protein